MQFVTVTNQHLKALVENLTIKDIKLILDYCDEFLQTDNFSYLPEFVSSKFASYNTKKQDFVDIFYKLLNDETFKELFYNKLSFSTTSKNVYNLLIWKKVDMIGSDLDDEFNLNLQYIDTTQYQSVEYNLDGNLSLISHQLQYSWQGLVEDIIFIKNEIREILKIVFPVPNDFNIIAIDSIKDTKYCYCNEDGIFSFIDTIEQMLKSNLVEFGKTNEKPLAKSLNILKSSSGLIEFYDKKLGLNATDMLTRSFSYYYWENRAFKDTPLESLKHFVKEQFNDNLHFFISRIFTSHLKKIRFDEYYTSQKELFDLIKYILDNMPQDAFISMENILSFCNYRNLGFHFDSPHKTNGYTFPCEIKIEDDRIILDEVYTYNYSELIYINPILKASFYFLASLGLVEIKYNDPKSQSDEITARGKEYISIWDNLKYIKFTTLGLYIFGYTKSYEVKEVVKQNNTTLKFDIYKPIITVDKNDSLNIAKLESYTIPFDTNRYILNSTKIFKDCKTLKALKLKMDNFYKIFGDDIPKVFKDFFTELETQSNQVQKENKMVTLQLQNNPKLISLFQSNKRLQEIIIKAQDYKVLVLKDDLPKFIKILKDNGFFLEF